MNLYLKPPNTVEEFLARPERRHWEAQIAAGWRGPDGSSSSTDSIMGVRIGITSPSWDHVDLPANRHDWYYRLGRLFRLPEEFRKAADAVYRDLCIERLRAALIGPMLWIGVGRAHVRYLALRVGARFAWTKAARARDASWSGE